MPKPTAHHPPPLAFPVRSFPVRSLARSSAHSPVRSFARPLIRPSARSPVRSSRLRPPSPFVVGRSSVGRRRRRPQLTQSRDGMKADPPTRLYVMFVFVLPFFPALRSPPLDCIPCTAVSLPMACWCGYSAGLLSAYIGERSSPAVRPTNSSNGASGLPGADHAKSLAQPPPPSLPPSHPIPRLASHPASILHPHNPVSELDPIELVVVQQQQHRQHRQQQHCSPGRLRQ